LNLDRFLDAWKANGGAIPDELIWAKGFAEVIPQINRTTYPASMVGSFHSPPAGRIELIISKEHLVSVTPKVFVSYSWDSEEHKLWVRELSAKLRSHGVDARIDHWHQIPGHELTLFMEQEVRDNDFVIVICTPRYKEKSDNRIGGVGYEGGLITAEIYNGGKEGKFLPVLREGDFKSALPSWFGTRSGFDLRNGVKLDAEYEKLRKHLLGQSEQAPPLGPSYAGD
jgi:hypothetical protein